MVARVSRPNESILSVVSESERGGYSPYPSFLSAPVTLRLKLLLIPPWKGEVKALGRGELSTTHPSHWGEFR